MQEIVEIVLCLLLGISWVIPPSVYSVGNSGNPAKGGAAAGVGPSNASPGPQFIPGELLQVESTREDGRYQSETQEKGSPPPPDAVAEGSIPGSSYGNVSPYDWLFVTGQYPPGTYTQSSSSFEKGSDHTTENHYLRYDYPDGPFQEQLMQTFPSGVEQSFQASGPGYQQGAGSDMGKGMQYYY